MVGASRDSWKCAMGMYIMPHAVTPYMMVASHADAYQLSMNIGHRPQTLEELAYVATFARRTRDGATELLAPGSRGEAAGSTVFVRNCYSHDVAILETCKYGDHSNGSIVSCKPTSMARAGRACDGPVDLGMCSDGAGA